MQTELSASDPTEAPPTSPPRPTRLARVRRWAWVGIRSFLQFLLVSWAMLAIYYSNLPWAWLRVLLAAAFVALAVWGLWLTRRPRMGWVIAGAFVVVLIWFASIRPSHNRNWRPEVAVLPRANVEGDRVRMTGVRNFDFRTVD